MKKRKWIIYMVILCTMVTFSQSTDRTWATLAEKEKQEAQENLQDVNNQIEDLKDRQEETKDKIEEVTRQLEQLFKQQNSLQKEIEENERQIETTALQLESAQREAAKQYEDMKVRIQYMYENSTADSILEAIIEADGLVDMLKRLEYVIAVHRSDRNLTRQYQETVAVVEARKTELEQQQHDLLFRQEAYLGRQSEIEGMIASLKDEQNSYGSQIAGAKRQAEEYKEIIRKQDAIIQKQQEEERNQANSNQSNNSTNSGSGAASSGNQGNGNVGRPSTGTANGENGSSGSGNEGNGNTGSDSTGDTSVSGMDIVNFARQFVGNPYVWGGNSLTNGCDCSGFVHLVYKNFGYTLPRYSMSFLNAGTPVSYEDMQPGDIVVYTRNSAGIGHVAIYMGNGKIVEAQSTSAGITDNRSVNYREILGIRRILK